MIRNRIGKYEEKIPEMLHKIFLMFRIFVINQGGNTTFNRKEDKNNKILKSFHSPKSETFENPMHNL
jgi:hypothetical protein